MTVTGPRVRDYTDKARTLHVEIDVSPAYELLLSLFVVGCGDCTEYDVGADWFDTNYAKASPELREGLDLILAMGELSVKLLGIVHDLPAPKTVEMLLSHLSDLDPVEFRTSLLRNALPEVAEDVLTSGDPASLAAAIGDDPHFVKNRASIEAVFALPAGEFRDKLVDTLRRYDAELSEDVAKLMPILERDATAKRAMRGTVPPERLVENATNGVTFAMQPDVSGAVLIPSVVIRPWVVISEHGSLRLFAYPVTDESITADPAAPPEWMVSFYKALGDEKRLRILGILSDGPESLRELTKRLGLSKSTVHHHVSILRRAGLVRITLGEDKEYSLRTDAVPEAGRLFETFLQPQLKES